MYPQFFNFTDKMSFFQLVLFFLACFIVYIVCGILIMEKVWPPKAREEFNDVISGFSVVLGIIFAVIVGSVIVAVWQYQDKADNVATQEADYVGDLFQMAPNTGLLDSPRLRTLLVQYSKNVIDVEWPLMRKSMKPTSGWNYLINIQKIITDCKPKSLQDNILVNNIQRKFTQLLDARRKRIAASLNNIPFVIYILIFFISAFLIFFTFFFGLNKWTHMLFCFCLSVLISLCIVVIIALDCPFRTQIRIDPIEMQRVNKLIVGFSSTLK